MAGSKKKCVLTIAGSDSSAGAGIQSDLKTFKNFGLYGLTVVTAVTSQNTRGVKSSFSVPSDAVRSQLDAVFSDFNIAAIKIGMLSSAKTVRIIARFFENRRKAKLIIDPVIYSKSGFPLLNVKAIGTLKSHLVPFGYLITPNIREAEILAGMKIRNVADIERAARKVYMFGCENVLIKGGHLREGIGLQKGTDVLYNGRKFTLFSAKPIESTLTHGIGCAFSAAITANIALGKTLKQSIYLSKKYVAGLLTRAVQIGKGVSPVEQ